MLDMMGLMLKGMGVDPEALLGQARQLGAAFDNIAKTQQAILDRLDHIETNQTAVMAAMGLYVPPPSPDVAQLIADETKRHLDAYGGPIVLALDP